MNPGTPAPTEPVLGDGDPWAGSRRSATTGTDPEQKSYLLPYRRHGGAAKYLEWAAKDGVNLITRPIYWQGAEWKRFGIGSAVTLGLFAVDQDTRRVTPDDLDPSSSDLLQSVSDSVQPLEAVSVLLFAGGLIGGNDRVADTGFLALESMFYGQLFSSTFKSLTHRERPWSAETPFEFYGPRGVMIDGTSAFISGHTMTAFAFAASVSEMWRKRWLSITLYSLAGLVALERIDSGAHWLSDVVGAALVGRAVGKRIVRFHYPRGGAELDPRRASFELRPLVGAGSLGVGATLRF